LNKYKAFWNGKTTEVEGETSLKARDAALAHFQQGTRQQVKPHMVTVIICERADGRQVSHNPAMLG